MKSSKSIVLAAIVFVCALLIGMFGFMLIEGYTYNEALYMSAITITTVGFGEVRPLSDGGRIFTTLLVVVGFVSLAFVGRAIVESFFEKIWNVSFKMNTMKAKISNLQNHIIVCGYGRVGSGAVDHLISKGVDFVVIERGVENCDSLRDKDILYVNGDASRESILESARISEASGLMALLDDDPDNLFLVLTAREMNPTLYIISRAEDVSSESKIIKAGADKVVTPYVSTGKQIADAVLNNNGVFTADHENIALPEISPQWILVSEGSSMVGETIAEVSKLMARQVYGLRREGNDYILPKADMRLIIDDQLLAIDDKEVNEDVFVNKETDIKKIVIVDDNPIILRLYSRLFHKFGFLPITACNGKEGFEIIMKEKPSLAVIDFMLPILSGIELCRQIRKEYVGGIRLILFTGDNQKDTRKRALEAGADNVIVKSSDAFEIIEEVMKYLKKEEKKKSKSN